MTPAARILAAADILDQISSSSRPAETILKDWGRQNRYAGAKDRRAIADRVYQCLRAKARLGRLMGSDTGRALVLGALALQDGLELSEIESLFSGEGYGPKPLDSQEREHLIGAEGDAPQWLKIGLPEFVVERFKATYGESWLAEAEALMQPRAPIDLRISGDRNLLMQAMRTLGYKPEFTPFSTLGLRLPSEPPPNIRALPAFANGGIEIQDEGSQIAAALTGAMPLETIIDYCAGGGGKTMAMLGATQGQAKIIACDIDQTRLNNIKPRLNRAGFDAELRLIGADGEGLEDFVGRADRVVVDAPCSGSGVWRRRPETAHNLKLTDVENLHQTQMAILDRAALLVKPNGFLIYITCSVLPDENESTVDLFESHHPEFKPFVIAEALRRDLISDEGWSRISTLSKSSQRLRLSPYSTNTDGFFIAMYEKKA